jgi:hypothetical protein
MQEVGLGVAILAAFVTLRFGVPAALMALFCACDRRFIHPAQPQL